VSKTNFGKEKILVGLTELNESSFLFFKIFKKKGFTRWEVFGNIDEHC
jgi:hypothetical protein